MAVVVFMVHSHHNSSIIIQDIALGTDLMEFTRVALYMAKRFIIQHTNTLIIMERCEFLCEEHRIFHVMLLQNFIPNLNYTLNIQLFFDKPDERPWDYNLFIIDSWWAFELSLLNTILTYDILTLI